MYTCFLLSLCFFHTVLIKAALKKDYIADHLSRVANSMESKNKKCKNNKSRMIPSAIFS